MTHTNYEAPLGIGLPRYQSRLVINAGYQISFERPIPNWWRRFWYWILLGWKWEKWGPL